MRRTYVYIISLLLITRILPVQAQDTITYPLKIKVGLDVSGPVIYFTDKNILSTEAYISVDLNPKTSIVLSGGYLDYYYSQYNYEYKNKGVFMRVGSDFNLRKPELSSDRFWAGIGLRYGLSVYTSETPVIQQTNYWGIALSSLPAKTSAAHFFEVTPGIRTEVFKNFSIGWSVSLRMLLYSGTGKDSRPIYLPGFGNSGKTFSSGFNYFLVFSIPYKHVKHIIKPELPDDTQEPPVPLNGQPGSQQ